LLGAVFWPVALFVAIETLARTAWPAGGRWVALRYLGLLPVAVVAAVVSYRHLSGLLAFYREDPLTARIGPLAVDGLMVMATGALIAAGATRRAGRQTTRPRDASPAGEPSPGAATAQSRSVHPASPSPAPVPARRTDADLAAVLARVPREPDGTVPVRRTAAALHCGPDRARRLLREAGLLKPADPPEEPSATAPVAA